MNDYFDYFDYDDYIGYFLSDSKTTVPNLKILVPMCDPNPKPLYAIYISVSYKIMHA